MKTNSLKLTCSLTIFSALSLAATAQTNLLMVGDPTGSTRMDDYFWGAGFGFYVPAGGGTMINALGFWDQGGDGLASSHDLALYQYSGNDSSYNLLASVTVQAGTADPLLGGYRWVNIPDLYLTDNGQDGDYYVILAAQGGGDLWTDLGSQSLNSVMGTFSSGALIANNSGQTLGQDPAVLVGGSAGYGGPNLAFIEAVPEPATGALMFGGLLAFAAMFLKKHQKGAIRKFNEKLS